MAASAAHAGASGSDGKPELVLAFDPGRNLGAAWVGFDGRVERQAILAAADLERLVLPPRALVLVGDGTGSATVLERLRRRGVVPIVVDEAGSTLDARKLYFRDHPPRGLMRLLPPGMRAPPRPIDDYAAVAIALRWLASEGAGHAGATPGA
ncbi:MAG TPA: hypothetical protein VKA00_01620 [Trueperaceae bacterium]|nr:hypothetical protein [Trueperaceae bacterium]